MRENLRVISVDFNNDDNATLSAASRGDENHIELASATTLENAVAVCSAELPSIILFNVADNADIVAMTAEHIISYYELTSRIKSDVSASKPIFVFTRLSNETNIEKDVDAIKLSALGVMFNRYGDAHTITSA